MTTKTKDGDRLIADVVKQHEKIERLRVEQQRRLDREHRRLAGLLVETRDHPDPDVNYSAAARALGTTRSYPSWLVKQFEAGKFDENGDADDGS